MLKSAKDSMTASVILLSSILVFATLISPHDAQAVGASARTVTFAKGSSSLTANSKSLLLTWKAPLLNASKITVTGFAPSTGRVTTQKKLATDRALAVANQLKKIGITATITKKVSLPVASTPTSSNANKATIVVTASKPSPSASASASASATASSSASASASPTASPSGSPSASASASPNASPSGSPVSKFKSSGSVNLVFVDCGQYHKQVVATSITFASTSVGVAPVVVDLSDSNTAHADNNMMNCSITWNDIELPADTYAVSIQAKCIDILDLDTTGSDACTPGKYTHSDVVTQISSPLTGSGPLGTSSNYRMSFNLPANIELTQDSSDNYEAALF